MDSGALIRTGLLLVSTVWVCVVSGSPIGTSEINCDRGSDRRVGAVNEGYSGDVELLSGIVAGSGVKLVPHLFPAHLEFLELSFTLGQTSATVRTRKTLDADLLTDSDSTLYYSVMCDNPLKYNNTRTLKVNDINDNGPVFTQDTYSVDVSEIADVDDVVLQVRAVDADSSPANNQVSYSYVPASDDFLLTNSGAFILKRRLNYNVVPRYNFLVTARDNWGLNDTAAVQIDVVDFDNLNPFFSHSVYQAFIPENQAGPFRSIEPEEVRAQDGDMGINMTLTYSISSVSPDEYRSHFSIEPSSGVVFVLTGLDREALNSSGISVRIKAAQTDDSSKTADAVVSVTVEDVNDNPPEFDQPEYSATLLENSPVNAVVFKAIVTDRDQGGFMGTLQIVPESAPFSIGSDGTVRVENSTALDRETTAIFTFQIKARETDHPNREAVSPVTVTLLDENDNSPEFTSSMYEGKVFANQTEGMSVVQIEAEDPDADENGQIRYSIEFGNDDGYFSMEVHTGVIRLAKIIPLVENTILQFPLYVTARDGGTISRSSAAQVNIRAPGNSKPQFIQKVYHGTIEEEQEPGVLILKVDFYMLPTENPVFTVETEADKFFLSPRGELRTAVKLDFDEAPHSYSVDISISDGLSSDSAVVEVQVTDVNDNSPAFVSESVTASVPEDADVGTNVTAVPATDKDSGFNQELRYSLRGGEGRFSVDPLSGTLSVAAALDRETAAQYELLLVAEDQGRPVRSATASLLVRVSDVNDNVPAFSQAEHRVPVSEVAPVGSLLLTLSATDPDQGANGSVSYRILQQSPPSDPPAFQLDSSSGALRLAGPLDYSQVREHRLLVQASDGGAPSLVANSSVVVEVQDVNNNPPEFSQESYAVSVPENLASGASVLSLQVTDRDQGGFVGTLQILPESAPFSISSDGTIRVSNSTALDRETTESFTFQVKARESQPPNHVSTATVTVTLLDENDNSPEFSSSRYESKVFTNQTEGMLLVQVEAEDADAGVNGQIRYSINFGNHNGYFSVDEASGAITLRRLIPVSAHQTAEFLLFVSATDGGAVSRSASAQVEILAVGDTKPQFTQSTFSGTIEEERDPGAVILQVEFLATGESPVTLRVETEADKFFLSPRGELRTAVKLDFDEAPHSYSVDISISDGLSSDSAVVEVQVTDVNDNSPAFVSESVTASVPEDADVGTNVTAVPATDKDSGFNQELRYSLRGGEGRFSVDPLSGTLSVAAALDRETAAQYELLLVAEDQGRPVRSATASLLVRVSDVNDNVPAFSQAEHQVPVSEVAPVGSLLLTLSATDPDQGANGSVSYRILQQSPPSDPPAFQLDSSSGALRLAGPLDYSQVREHRLLVQASDGGAPSLVANSSVVVEVQDVNNNPPEFSQESYAVSVPENLASGASVLSLQVTDRDQGGFSDGFFIFTSDTFDINPQGVVSLKRDVSLDRETEDSYVFQVVAVDQVSDGLSSTAQINITVLDYNDNAPQFPSIPDPLEIPEGDYSEKNPGEVYRIVPTDADLGPNGEVALSLSSPHPLFRFREDGTLLAVAALDRETKETYELLVKAADGGSPQRENVTTVSVRLIDVNDNAPKFSSDSYVSSVLLRDAEDGKLLLTLSAADEDAGTNSLISYSFSAGSSPYLALDSETGDVTLTSAVTNVTEDTTLVLTATAEDHGRPPLNSTARLVVNLRLVSLVEAVAFWNSSYTFSLPENGPTGALAGEVRASSGSHLYAVAYALKTHTDLFTVDADGAVRTRAPLDREQQEWYFLDVEAVDTRTPPTSALTVVRVQVQDVNEAPQFPSDVYKASVFSIAPYKTPVLRVQASDPDLDEEGRLVYSLTAGAPFFDVDPASGLLYVVSAEGLAGETAAVEVKAEDPRRLHAMTRVEVEVKGSASSGDVAFISLNQPANTVERKVPQLERALAAALAWNVSVTQVSSAGAASPGSRSPSAAAAAKTLVGFISSEGGEVVSSEDVNKKLQSQAAAVTAQLVQVFGEELHFQVELQPAGPAPSQAPVIALGVLLALSLLGLSAAVAVVIRFKVTQKHETHSDRGLCIEPPGYRNWTQDAQQTSEKEGAEPKDRSAGEDRDGQDSHTSSF